ncbi:hypothetical protein DFR29_105126 [Tahibacter aquaticus]|uniref:Uncharacterized protein n=1 Tax=Tahibacter aquaticus TaxID=520092 RepID=A0A4R6Z092_9GAMM|nr:hypothetical protein [Tahibacter aquaticus]TDR44943.1 hypothetical protein DFR29_105126 [Tahibacter aquaticus]
MNIISLGDLLIAFDTLKIDTPQQREEVCRLLLAEPPADAVRTGTVARTPAPPQLPAAKPPNPQEPAGLAPATPPQLPYEPAGQPADAAAEFDYRAFDHAAPAPIDCIRIEAGGGQLLHPGDGAVAAAEPLLERSWERRVLGALLATDAALGSLDERALIRQLLRGRPVRKLPRRIRPTMQRGAQVLLDRHLSMMVFFADQTHLRHVIQGIVGRERVQVLRCVGFPPAARSIASEPPAADLSAPGRHSRKMLQCAVAEPGSEKWHEYRPPPPQTPVLIVSDLGLVRGAHVPQPFEWARWLNFTELLQANRNPLYALVPDEAERCLDALRERVRVLAWDRHTRPSHARQLRRARAWQRSP